MRAMILVGATALVAATGIGVWAGRNHTPPQTVLAVRQNAPLVAKPGREAATAAKQLATLEPPPPPAPKLVGPPKPPPIDVAVPFRRDVRALDPEQGRLYLTAGRPLKLGDVYLEGWKLAGVTSRSATLSKGRESRTIDFFAPDPAQVAALAQAQSAPALTQVSFTNGVKPGQLPPNLTSQLLAMMRQSGVAESQVEAMRRSLESGPATQASLMPIVMGMARNGRVPPAQLSRFVESLSRLGIIPPEQVQGISNSISQVAASRQTDQILQTMGRAGGANQGFQQQQQQGFGPNTRRIGFGDTPPGPQGRRGQVGAPVPPPRATVLPAPSVQPNLGPNGGVALPAQPGP